MKQNLSSQIAFAVAIAMGAAVSAQADTFSGSTSGTFINPVAGGDNLSSHHSGEGTSTFMFGQGNPENSLNFVGDSFSGVAAGVSFDVGTLSYHNASTTSGTSVDQITLDVNAVFTLPFSDTKDFDFPLNITVTPNTGTDKQNADYITLPSVSPETFTVDGVTYTLGLTLSPFTGNSDQGYTVGNTFHVYEGGNATADITGVITTDLNYGVPDSSSTMMLLGGIGSVLCYARRKLS